MIDLHVNFMKDVLKLILALFVLVSCASHNSGGVMKENQSIQESFNWDKTIKKFESFFKKKNLTPTISTKKNLIEITYNLKVMMMDDRQYGPVSLRGEKKMRQRLVPVGDGFHLKVNRQDDREMLPQIITQPLTVFGKSKFGEKQIFSNEDENDNFVYTSLWFVKPKEAIKDIASLDMNKSYEGYKPILIYSLHYGVEVKDDFIRDLLKIVEEIPLEQQ